MCVCVCYSQILNQHFLRIRLDNKNIGDILQQ